MATVAEIKKAVVKFYNNPRDIESINAMLKVAPGAMWDKDSGYNLLSTAHSIKHEIQVWVSSADTKPMAEKEVGILIDSLPEQDDVLEMVASLKAKKNRR